MKRIMKITNLISSLVLLLVSAGCLLGAPTTTPPFVLAYQARNTLYVTTNGNNVTASRGQSDLPWATIDVAASKAKPGDRILLGSGDFNIGFISVPVSVSITGFGTNITKVHGGTLELLGSNELSGFTIDDTVTPSGNVLAGVIELRSYCNVHNLKVVSDWSDVSLGDSSGYNFFTNCLFSTSKDGIFITGKSYFFNCSISKGTNTSTDFTRLVRAGSGSTIYWSGGSITSLTNSTGQSTNNYAIDNSISGPNSIYIQNTTISTPLGGFDIFGVAANTNYISSVTWSGTKTNLIAKVVSFSGFPNTNSLSHKWIPSWNSGNTNKPPVLLVPPH